MPPHLTLRELIRLRPGTAAAYHQIAASLAYLGRLEEARATLDRVEKEFAEDVRRYRQRPPWLRPEDYAIRIEGLRLAGSPE